MTIELSPALLSGYLLALARAGAWVFLVPPLGTRSIPLAVKAGLAAALALAVGPRLEAQAVPLEVGPLASAAFLQVGAGLALGFIGVLFFSAASLAGGLIDLFSGFSSAQLFDPGTGAANSLFGRFYSVLATTLLFAIDGHLLLTRGFLTSFDAAPLTSLNLADLAEALTDGAGTFFLAAVEIAAPLLAALFLAEVAMGLLARAAPHMNVFLLGLPVKILITLFLAGIALPLLPQAVSGLLEPIIRTGADVLGN